MVRLKSPRSKLCWKADYLVGPAKAFKNILYEDQIIQMNSKLKLEHCPPLKSSEPSAFFVGSANLQ